MLNLLELTRDGGHAVPHRLPFPVGPTAGGEATAVGPDAAHLLLDMLEMKILLYLLTFLFLLVLLLKMGLQLLDQLLHILTDLLLELQVPHRLLGLLVLLELLDLLPDRQDLLHLRDLLDYICYMSLDIISTYIYICAVHTRVWLHL